MPLGPPQPTGENWEIHLEVCITTVVPQALGNWVAGVAGPAFLIARGKFMTLVVSNAGWWKVNLSGALKMEEKIGKIGVSSSWRRYLCPPKDTQKFPAFGSRKAQVTTILVELIRVINSIRYKDETKKNINNNKFEREQICFDRNDECRFTSLILFQE